MKNESLLERLKKLGFPLFETEGGEDANLALADVARSGDLRFLEGFPVVLATNAENGLFDYGKASAYLKKSADRSVLASLVAMSLALYKFLKVKFSWTDTMHNSLNAMQKKEAETFFAELMKGRDLKVAGQTVSAERLRNTFKSYFQRKEKGLHDLLSAKEELGLEYALSQVFSPKQKELFLKKLRGEVLTKTEKEYFSRVVKKKALALANTDLYHLSQKLVA